MAKVEWRVPRWLLIGKLAGTAVFAALTVWYLGDWPRTLVAALATALLGGHALRDLIAGVRISADERAVTVVSGYVGRRRIPWGDVERVRVDSRSRLGLRSDLLEIDTGEELFLFSSWDLGVPCDQVAERLATLRPA